MRRIAFALSLVLTAVLAPSAWADETIRAAISNRYTNPNVSIDQGEPLSFFNGDTARHDVTAAEVRDGRALFSTPLLAQNQTAFVDGSQYLTTGSYGFFCSVHPFMTGTLTVTGAGTPAPRPGSGGGADTTPPAVEARVTSGSRRGVRRARGIRVRLTTNEAVTARVRIVSGGRTIATGRGTIAEDTPRTLTARLTTAGRRAAARRRALVVRVTVTAKDAAGNEAVTTVGRTLR